MSRRRIDDQMLLDYAAGLLDTDSQAEVKAAIEIDPDLASTVQRYRMASTALAADDSVEPPVDVVSRAKAIFAVSLGQPAGTIIGAAKEILARLIFDSRVQPATVRSSALDQPVQLSFETDDVALDLQATRTGNSPDSAWQVIGQFAIDEYDNDIPLNISTADGSVAAELAVSCDEPFTVELSPGQYVIQATMNESIVTFSDIEL